MHEYKKNECYWRSLYSLQFLFKTSIDQCIFLFLLLYLICLSICNTLMYVCFELGFCFLSANGQFFLFSLLRQYLCLCGLMHFAWHNINTVIILINMHTGYDPSARSTSSLGLSYKKPRTYLATVTSAQG